MGKRILQILLPAVVVAGGCLVGVNPAGAETGGILPVPGMLSDTDCEGGSNQVCVDFVVYTEPDFAYLFGWSEGDWFGAVAILCADGSWEQHTRSGIEVGGVLATCDSSTPGVLATFVVDPNTGPI